MTTMRQPGVLVTGGCGFIGANLIRSLVSVGYQVRVLDDLSSGRRENLAGIDAELIDGDVCDPQTVERAMVNCTGIVHLAAKSSVLESTVDPWPTFDVNERGTLTVLQAAVRTGVGRFVLASSNAALGEHEPPLNEDLVARPVSPYGASKLAGEAYCMAHFGTYGLGTVALRFSNVYGPYSGHKTSVIAKFIRMLLEGEPITIYGDGLQTRDFIYVDDVSWAIVAALESKLAGEVLQIGTGDETPILALVEMLSEITGIQPDIRWLEQPSGEIRRNYASIERARRELGFNPKTDLRSGLEATVDWFASNQEALSLRQPLRREGVADD